MAEMLAACGVGSIQELLEKSLPSSIRSADAEPFSAPKSEAEVLARLNELADKNQVFVSLLGLGYYDSFLPPVIRKGILENPSWYTAYTPYQPEISQGRLELLLAFQTLVTDLTGMELANASLLDEATAAAEAMTLLARVAETVSKRVSEAADKADKNASAENRALRFGVDEKCYPQTLAVLKTRAEPLGIELVPALPDRIPPDCFGVFFQLEDVNGELRDLGPAIQKAHSQKALVCIAADPLALCLVKPPGEQGADAVVGTTQRFGTPLGFGGPHAGYIAVREEYQRALPGRLVGVSKDTEGRPAHRLTLQTREQHIRKEKATSNICTAQVLLAVISALYAIYHGQKGMIKIAEYVQGCAAGFKAALESAGIDLLHHSFFGTLSIKVPKGADKICAAAAKEKINLRRIDADSIAVAFDETTTPEILLKLCEIFGIKDYAFDKPVEVEKSAKVEKPEKLKSSIPAELQRKSPPLPNPVFSKDWSEAEFVRYLKQLADKDLALDRSMIPLGSCTMKLNSATEMSPLGMPAFTDIHPFAPIEQAQGYMELLQELGDSLVQITGMDAVSLQPNAGSQGELAGLLAIASWHLQNGDDQRKICLIPVSAHGTNSASAVMAGFEVLGVKCDSDGNVNLEDLSKKASAHSKELGALMITYPSTHGIFEPHILKICEKIHSHGGQVYMDGANLNALIGLAKPGGFGVDVAHLNLHKTFCIPHGGGGPGAGPIVAKKHLAPYLPGHPFHLQHSKSGAVSAAPWGSASILPISWSYIQLMGSEGLKSATQTAILSANYLASQLSQYFPVLYTGPGGRVAHECVLDLRAFRKLVSVEDVAKRLMDYGFHAPTVSFPVADTLMVEPTESESKAELDRFIQAMAEIRREIKMIETKKWDPEINPLKLAPHTAQDVISDSWDRPYSRETAAYPLPYIRESKYWPPVSRIDSAWGDRNLFCTCPAISAD